MRPNPHVIPRRLAYGTFSLERFCNKAGGTHKTTTYKKNKDATSSLSLAPLAFFHSRFLSTKDPIHFHRFETAPVAFAEGRVAAPRSVPLHLFRRQCPDPLTPFALHFHSSTTPLFLSSFFPSACLAGRAERAVVGHHLFPCSPIPQCRFNQCCSCRCRLVSSSPSHSRLSFPVSPFGLEPEMLCTSFLLPSSDSSLLTRVHTSCIGNDGGG